MNYTLRFDDNVTNWNNALKQIMAVPGYRKFFELTSPHEPMLVHNMTDIPNPTSPVECHKRSEYAVENYSGMRISGWYVICNQLFNEVPAGVCHLVNHSNVLFDEEKLFVNPVGDFGRLAHIFIPDGERAYDVTTEVGYNDRLYFTDDYLGDDDLYGEHSVVRNSVYFKRNSYIDNHPDAEKYATFYSMNDLLASIPAFNGEEAFVRKVHMNSKIGIRNKNT